MIFANGTLFSRPDILKPEGFRISAFCMLLSTISINILSLALPVMTSQVYNRILPNPGTGTLSVLMTGVCVAVLLESMLRLCRSYMTGWAGATYEHRLSCAAMDHVLKTNPLHLNSQGVGEHLHRMASIGKIKDFYNGYVLMTWTELAFVPLFFGLIFYISGPLVIVPGMILALFTLISIQNGYKLRRLLKARDEADDRRFNFLIESLEGIHMVKAFALERFFERRYETLEKASSVANYHVTEDTASTFNTGTVFSHLMVAAVISFGAGLVLEGHLTTGALIATLLLSGRMMQPIQRVLALWAKYQDYALSREKLETLFTAPVLPVAVNAHEPVAEGKLEISALGFKVRENDPWILRDVSLEMEVGDTVLVNGEYGSGKTTLLELIAGIYPATQGSITIDGQNVIDYPEGSLSRHIGYIRSESLIFRGTIRDNLTCFGLADEKSAREIAAMLKVDRDVSRLPSGFDTFLNGNATDTIPPGLKQRIAMARALSTRPRLVLFDNAERGLDREGYGLVYSLLAGLKGKTTLILVTEDQNLRRLADRSFTLKEGRLERDENTPKPGNIEPYREHGR